jgi:hypothetical protein
VSSEPGAGQFALAYALAQQSRTASDEQISVNALKLMEHLRTVGVLANSPTLKNPWRRDPLDLLAHTALLLALPATIFAALWLESSYSSSVRPSPQTRQDIPSTRPAPPLRKQEPLRAKCAFPATNGEILATAGRKAEKGHVLQIKNGSGGNAIVKVRDGHTGALFASFYVASNQTASLDGIPDGTYRFQYALGGDLAADCKTFLVPTTVAQFTSSETFRTEKNSFELVRQQLTYTLYSVPGGNVRPQSLDVTSFNAD